MVKLFTLAAVAAQALSAEAAATSLNAAAQAAGLLYFGTAVDNGDLGDSQYKSILASQFGQITPANSMKWGPTEPQQNQYSYGDGDTIANLAATNGQKLRCHNLIWYQQTPNWLGSTSWTNQTLIKAVTDHITSAVTHYKGKCYAWDVLNEALNEDGTLRSWTLSNIIGEAYIPIIFKAARAADPNVKLYYNDYNIENPGAKSTGAQNIVKLLQRYGAPIDGVGFESHFIAGSSPSVSQLTQNMAAFKALGVDVAITELDVRQTLPESSSGDQQQATDYVNTVSACLQSSNCVGVTVWDFVDKYSWVPGTFSGQGAADLYGGSSGYSAKPAYSSVLSYLNAHTRSGGGSTPTTTAVTTTAKPTTTPAKTTMSTIATTTTTASGGTGSCAALYGQCGGQGWGGATCCSQGTCKSSNPYYSQCL